MWAKDSEISTIKEGRGTRVSHRVDPGDSILNGLRNRREVDSVFTFAVALMPFFNSENIAVVSFTNTNEYKAVVENNRVFQGMAWYLKRLTYKVDPSFEETFNTMASEFEGNPAPLSVMDDEYVAALRAALMNWKPSGVVKDFRRTVEKVMRVALVEFGKASSREIKVRIYILFGPTNRLNFFSHGTQRKKDLKNLLSHPTKAVLLPLIHGKKKSLWTGIFIQPNSLKSVEEI